MLPQKQQTSQKNQQKYYKMKLQLHGQYEAKKIDNNNRKIMSNGREREEFTRTCNCRDKTLCPLKEKCLQEGVVYKAIVTQTESMKQDIYIGMTENPFKTRYNLHNSSFRVPHKRSTTTLSEHLWT